jgi:hypothetical protein
MNGVLKATLEIVVTIYFKVPRIPTFLAVVRKETFTLPVRTATPHYADIFIVNRRLSVTYLGSQYDNISCRQNCNKSDNGWFCVYVCMILISRSF